MRAARTRVVLTLLLGLGCGTEPSGVQAPPAGSSGSGGASSSTGGLSGIVTGGSTTGGVTGGTSSSVGGAASGMPGTGGASGGVAGASAGGGAGGTNAAGESAAGSSGAAGAAGGAVAGSSGAGGNSGAAGAGGGAGTAGTGGGVTDPGTEGDGDFKVGPSYTDSPDLAQKDVPKGTLYDFTMKSEDSQIFRGDDATLLPQNQHSFERDIRVYVPAQYVDGTPAPFMIVQDGYVGDISRALDNLIAETTAERRLPAIVAIFVANGGDDSKGSERGLEYDTLSDRYTRFIDTEVLPAVLANQDLLADHPNFALTDDPEGRGAYGCSSGGAAAFTMGWFSPDKYRRIITYSGTFVDQQDDDAAEEDAYPLGAWDYHERLIAESDPKPLRVFLEVGSNDNGANDSEAGHHNWVMANQRMAEDLAAKGYHYRFVYAENSGHCDGAVRRQTLPDTLLWMWRGYPLE